MFHLLLLSRSLRLFVVLLRLVECLEVVQLIEERSVLFLLSTVQIDDQFGMLFEIWLVALVVNRTRAPVRVLSFLLTMPV